VWRKDLHPVPIFDENTEKIKKYEYVVGSLLRDDKMELFHFFIKSFQMAFPPSLLGRCVNLQDGKLHNMKTPETSIVYCIVTYLTLEGYFQRIPTNAFFRELCSKSLRVPDLERLEKSRVFTLCSKLDQIFPPSFFDVMIHVAIHLEREAKVSFFS
jgi:hypothetical protein